MELIEGYTIMQAYCTNVINYVSKISFFNNWRKFFPTVDTFAMKLILLWYVDNWQLFLVIGVHSSTFPSTYYTGFLRNQLVIGYKYLWLYSDVRLHVYL